MKTTSKFSKKKGGGYSPTMNKNWAPLNTFMFAPGGKVGNPKDRKRAGSSNAGKYSKSEGPFCGPSGGAAKGTYPIGSSGRGRSALKLAHNAPNPSGIKGCVYRHYPELKPKARRGMRLGSASVAVDKPGKKDDKKLTVKGGSPMGNRRGQRGGPRNGTGPRAKMGLCKRSKFSKACGGKMK